MHARNARKRFSQQNMKARFMPLKDMQLRSIAPALEGGAYTFEGYAVVWDSVNQHGERFVKGAFAEQLASGERIHMYYNHGHLNWWDATSEIQFRIGKWISLVEDETGLKVTGELTPNLRIATDVAAMLEHGTVDGLSVCFFEPQAGEFSYVHDVCVITKARMYEISPVDDPSDLLARIGEDLDNFDEIQSEVDAAVFLERSFGMNGATATKLLARLKQVPVSTPIEKKSDSLAWLDDLRAE